MSDGVLRDLLPPGSRLADTGDPRILYDDRGSPMTVEEAFMTLYFAGWEPEHFLWFFRDRFNTKPYSYYIETYVRYGDPSAHGFLARMWTEGLRSAASTHAWRHGDGYVRSPLPGMTLPPYLASAVETVFRVLQEVATSDLAVTTSSTPREREHSYDNSGDRCVHFGDSVEEADGYSSETMRESSPDDGEDAAAARKGDDIRSFVEDEPVNTISAATTASPHVIRSKPVGSPRRFLLPFGSPPPLLPWIAAASTRERGNQTQIQTLPPPSSASLGQETDDPFRAQGNDDNNKDSTAERNKGNEEGNSDNDNGENDSPERALLQQEVDAAQGAVLVAQKQLALYARRYDKHGGDTYDPDGAHGLRLAANLQAATRKLEDKRRQLDAYVECCADADVGAGKGGNGEKGKDGENGGDDGEKEAGAGAGAEEKKQEQEQEQQPDEEMPDDDNAWERTQLEIAKSALDKGMAYVQRLKDLIGQTKKGICSETAACQVLLEKQEFGRTKLGWLVELERIKGVELRRAEGDVEKLAEILQVLNEEKRQQQQGRTSSSSKRDYAEHVTGGGEGAGESTTPRPPHHRLPPTRPERESPQRRALIRSRSPSPVASCSSKKRRLSSCSLSPWSSWSSDTCVGEEPVSAASIDATADGTVVSPTMMETDAKTNIEGEGADEDDSWVFSRTDVQTYGIGTQPSLWGIF
ncbi:hypothetical protein SLS62_006633 [Diatrype stigma]|uniref:Uncharacterized protein n=1 Tax=Diatrype stigma TaxID=117547 RepID=A0AAN9UR12_9PEZI